MADSKVKVVEQNVALERAKGFWAKYSKPIIYAGTAVILLAGAWLVYKYWFKLPKEEKANEAVFVTQKNYADFTNAPDDSTRKILGQKVLSGEAGAPGAIKIMDQYSGTAAANLCHYYAGAVSLHLKQFDKAIKYLEDFSTSSTQIQSHAYGMMADAYSELKKNDDAFKYYKKAATNNEKDEFTAPEYLFRAAQFAQTLGKKQDAIDLFKQVRDDYPNSQHAAEVDKFLASLGELN